MNETPTPPAPREVLSGFLVAAVLIGGGIGFAIVDLQAVAHGYSWDSPKYANTTLVCAFAGSMLGLVVGYFLDLTLSRAGDRQGCLTALYVTIIASVLLFALLRPVLQAAR